MSGHEHCTQINQWRHTSLPHRPSWRARGNLCPYLLTERSILVIVSNKQVCVTLQFNNTMYSTRTMQYREETQRSEKNKMKVLTRLFLHDFLSTIQPYSRLPLVQNYNADIQTYLLLVPQQNTFRVAPKVIHSFKRCFKTLHQTRGFPHKIRFSFCFVLLIKYTCLVISLQLILNVTLFLPVLLSAQSNCQYYKLHM